MWNSKKKYQTNNFSISKELRSEKRSNEEFEIMVGALSLEEIIALKLELAAKTVNGKLYGMPLWSALPDIARDAVFKYAVSVTRSKSDAARFLGINLKKFNQLKKKYGGNTLEH